MWSVLAIDNVECVSYNMYCYQYDNILAGCSNDEFQCNDQSCIKGGNSIRCDGSYDCTDGSDEDACGKFTRCNACS